MSKISLPLGVLAAAVVLWTGAYVWEYKIDDMHVKPDSRHAVERGSAAVAVAATLMDRQIHDAGWAPNKPWFFPIAHSTNMKAYQRGVQYAVARWANEMADFLGRERGSGEGDPDLTAAKGLFSYDPTAFLLPSAVGQYEEGIQRLAAYNRRLAAGQAKYDRLSSNLSDVLVRISKDLGSQSATLELTVLSPEDLDAEERARLTDKQKAVLESNGGYFDGRAAETFYATKGRLFAYAELLEALGEDYRDPIAAKGAKEHWAEMVTSLRAAARLGKYFVANGSADAYFTPNDLAAQGFFLMRANQRLREVADILNR